MTKYRKFIDRTQQRVHWFQIEDYFNMRIEAAKVVGDQNFVAWLDQLLKELRERVFPEANLIHRPLMFDLKLKICQLIKLFLF